MTVAEMERHFFELKGKLQVGAITETEFRAEMQKFQFSDSSGKWWMLGAQSGQWYGFEGTRWLPGTPPLEFASEPAASVNLRGETPESVTQAIRRIAQPPAALPTPSSLYSLESERATRAPRFATLPPPRSSRISLVPIVLLVIAIFGLLLFLGGVWFVSTNVLSRSSTPVAKSNGGALAPNANTFVMMGDRLLFASNVDAAITQYENAAKLAPMSAIPLTRLARTFGYRGQAERALEYARKAAQLAPGDADANAALARALLWSGQIDQAVSAGEKAVSADKQNANAHAAVAEAYSHAKRPPDAQKAAFAALQFAPNGAAAQRAQAWVLTLGGQKQDALAAWNKTVALEPNFYFRHFEQAEVLRVFFALPADAVTEYQRALALYGAYIPARSRLGYALIDANQPQEAVAQLLRALTLDPNNAEIAAYLGVAFQRQNKCGQALAYFDLALKLDPNNGIALKGLAECKSGKTPSPVAPVAPGTPLVVPTLTGSR